MWAFWFVVGAVAGRLTSVEARRALRWKLHKMLDGPDHVGATVRERVQERFAQLRNLA